MIAEKENRQFSFAFLFMQYTSCYVWLSSEFCGFVSRLFSLLVLAIVAGAAGQKRYSVIGDYYWTEPNVSTDFAILLFLLVFLICTDLPLVVASTNLGFAETWVLTIIVFATGLISAMVLAIQKNASTT